MAENYRRVAEVRGAFRARRSLARASEGEERGSRGPKGDLQGKVPVDGASPGQSVRKALPLSL
jgi:hypothetical protein